MPGGRNTFSAVGVGLPVARVIAGRWLRRLRKLEAVYSAYVGHNDIIFEKILSLHVPKGVVVADVTYGRGTFWKKVPQNKYKLLTSDLQTGVDCRYLPYADNSVGAVVLDPPYMEGLYRRKHQKPITHGDFRARYSDSMPVIGGPKYHQAVLALYRDAGNEAVRVLVKTGILIVKCQDEVSNHKQELTHVQIINDYERRLGLSTKDLFVVVRPDFPSVGRIIKQQHARKRHSYFLVFCKK